MDFAKVKEYQSLEASDEIKFYKRFEHTALYKNYLQVKDSKDLKRLEELRVQTSAEAFKQKVNYLKDKNRYKTTEEFKLEDEFNRLKNSVMMHDYQKLKNARELQFFSQWDIAFEDNFKDGKFLDKALANLLTWIIPKSVRPTSFLSSSKVDSILCFSPWRKRIIFIMR